MAGELDFTAMENCVCFNLRRVTRVATQRFDAEMRRRGLRPTQTPILAMLAERPDLGMSDLSDALGMDRTTLLRNLRPLERDGLVATSGSGRGGRLSLSVTEKGRKTLAQTLPAWQAAQESVVASLGAMRWSAVLADLNRAAEALKS